MEPSVRAGAASAYWESLYEKVATLEFDRDRKSMSVFVRPRSGDDKHSLFVKGAPESVVERCTSFMDAEGNIKPMTKADKDVILKQVAAYGIGASSLRVLAFAIKPSVSPPESMDLSNPKTFASIECDLQFVGIAGMLDPPRPEVADAIAV